MEQKPTLLKNVQGTDVFRLNALLNARRGTDKFAKILQKQNSKESRMKKLKNKQITKSLSIILNQDKIDSKIGLSNQYNAIDMMGFFKKGLK